MNKKLLSVAISSFMLLSMADFSFAAKKDVSDPVLQQIISELSDRMPRFINKYGASVFVEDEQITRGALLQALYEFDKKSSSSSSNIVSTSVSSSGVISKKDYDALSAKVAALEKKVKSGAGASSSGGSSDIDIVQIMNDLEPNMPMMLDNSLASSKVFRDLEARVNAGGGKGSSSSASAPGVSQAAVTSLQRNLGELSVKVNNMEEMLAKGGGSKTNISSSVLKDIQKNINDLNTKYDSIESTLAKGGSVSGDTKTNISSSVLKDIQRNINDLNSKYNDIETTLAKSSKGGSSLSSVSQEEVNGLKKTLVQMQQSYVTLGKRVDSMEKEQSLLASSSSNSSSSSLSDKQMRLITSKINSIREDVDNIKIDSSKASNDKSSADIKKIEKRLSNLENSEKAGSSGSGSGSSKTGTVAKVSLGLSLVAALFIAR